MWHKKEILYGGEMNPPTVFKSKLTYFNLKYFINIIL